jgi:hypothetical protein
VVAGARRGGWEDIVTGAVSAPKYPAYRAGDGAELSGGVCGVTGGRDRPS